MLVDRLQKRLHLTLVCGLLVGFEGRLLVRWQIQVREFEGAGGGRVTKRKGQVAFVGRVRAAVAELFPLLYELAVPVVYGATTYTFGHL